MGGFAGSTFLMAAQHGISRAVYSGDIGIGYDATIQSETRSQAPEKQARLAIVSLLTDSIVCSLSILVVLVTVYGRPHLPYLHLNMWPLLYLYIFPIWISLWPFSSSSLALPPFSVFYCRNEMCEIFKPPYGEKPT